MVREFTENLEDTEVLHPHTFLMTQIRNVLRKWHQGSTVLILTSRKTEIARSARGPKLKEPRAEDALAESYLVQKFCWWFDCSRSQSSQWRKWFAKQSSILSRGTRFCYSMDSVVPVQNKNGSGDRKEFTKVSRAVYNSSEFGKASEDLSWNHCTSTPHRSETNVIAERAVRWIKRRDVCCVIAIQLGWKIVIWSSGTILLLSKCSRPPGRRRKQRMKGDSENHSKARSYRSVLWLNIIRFLKKKKKRQGSTNLVRKSCQKYSSDMHWWEGDLKRRYFGRRHWGVGEPGPVRNRPSKAQCKRSINVKKGEHFKFQSHVEQQNCLQYIMKSEKPLKGGINL